MAAIAGVYALENFLTAQIVVGEVQLNLVAEFLAIG